MDTRPTFQAVREHHTISLDQLSAESHCHLQEICLIDAFGRGTPEMIDALLASLSRLSGETTPETMEGDSLLLCNHLS